MKFYLKQREYLGKVLVAFGGYKSTFGKWMTCAKADTLEEARGAFTHRNGMMQYAIFHGGKRIEWIAQ